MSIDTLIDMLARDTPRVPQGVMGRRLAAGIVAGGAVALAVVVFGLGLRPDLRVAVHSFAFWMKWTYTISLGIGAIAMVARLARPEPVRLGPFWPVALPVVLLAILAAVELADAPAGDRLTIWLGATWWSCPWLVLMLSAPIFAGLLWSFRRLAPTRLRAAGAAAGSAAGAWAAAVYCLHCPEVSAAFVLTWYTLGIGLAAAAGALLGPRLLRW